MDTRSPRFDAGESQGSASGAACPPEFGAADADGHEDVTGQAKAALADLSRHAAEIKAYASHYVTAKLDGIKLTARNAALYAALGVLGLMAGMAVVATAAVVFVLGIAHGLAALFHGREWAGELIGGVVILGVVMGGAYFAISRMISGSKVKTVGKYEQYERRQRQQFGSDVHQRAGEKPAGK